MAQRRNPKHLTFDPYFFEKQARAGQDYTLEETFQQIYEAGHWNADSVSGSGSTDEQTRQLHIALPALLESLKAEVLLDLPCGDLSWMHTIDLPVDTYIGADLIPDLVARNRERFAALNRHFEVLDLTCDLLPKADVLLCRDCLVHFSFEDFGRALANIKRSPIRFLLTTTFPNTTVNEDITTGDWRTLNLERAPFNFPPSLALLNEHCTESDGRYADKSLGLWRVEDL